MKSIIFEAHFCSATHNFEAKICKKKEMKSGPSEPPRTTCSDEVGFSMFFYLCVIILFISSTAPTILRVFPQVKVNGGVVPVIFRDRPTYYHMYVVSTVFAFMCAYSALVIQRKHMPRVEKFCRMFAVASMFSALVILLYAAALWFVVPSPPQ